MNMVTSAGIPIARVWAMASPDTFQCEPILGFVQKYLMNSEVSVDPFARNSRLCRHTNDLNPNTNAEYHLEAQDFLGTMFRDGIKADLVIFDPPYSMEQISRSYQDVGLKWEQFKEGAENPTGGFPKVRRLISKLLKPGGICLSFGWNSCGIGKTLGFELIELLLVCHGGNKNDTICVAERKTTPPQYNLLLSQEPDL